MLGYKHVYNELLKKRPTKSTTTIVLEWIPPDKKWDEKGYWGVTGREPRKSEAYALDLSSFAQWAGFVVITEHLFRRDKVSLLCHILWEMTFHGYTDKQIGNIRREIFKLKDSIDNNRRSERK